MRDVAYLDHAASTPLRPEAQRALVDVHASGPGNPNGMHGTARRARQVLEDAREEMACLLGARPAEVVCTSGGTESDNLAIAGVLAARPGAACCPASEHEAVREPVRRAGGRVVRVGPDGAVDLDALAAELDPGVSLVSVMLVNNELGTVTDLAAVAAVVREHAPRAVLHTDAVQAAPWLDLAEAAAPADLVSISGHKVGAPVGVGALVVRGGVPLRAQLLGGGQELERRSGTQDVAGAAALAAALRASAADAGGRRPRLGRMRDRLADTVASVVDDVIETVPRARTAPGFLHLLVPGVEAEALLVLLDRAGVHASAASACASGATTPSHVLAALGLPPELVAAGVRFSLGWSSTEADVDRVLDVLPDAVRRLRRSEHRRVVA